MLVCQKDDAKIASILKYFYKTVAIVNNTPQDTYPTLNSQRMNVSAHFRFLYYRDGYLWQFDADPLTASTKMLSVFGWMTYHTADCSMCLCVLASKDTMLTHFGTQTSALLLTCPDGICTVWERRPSLLCYKFHPIRQQRTLSLSLPKMFCPLVLVGPTQDRDCVKSVHDCGRAVGG